MLKVHHLGISQSDRAVWLCEELGLPYELIKYDRDAVTKLAPESYSRLHPSGTAPVIEDDGLVIAESGAVLEYIARKLANGRLTKGPEDKDFAEYLYWFHFANGTMMPNALVELALTMADASREGETLKGLIARHARAFAMVDRHLEKATWFAGDDFTLADIMMAFPLTTMRAFVPHDIAEYSALKAYLQRLGDRPAYRTACQKADPDFPPVLT